MKSLLLFSLAIAAIFSLSGCLQEEKTLKLNSDGSGTIVETVLLSKDTIAQMQQMTASLGALTGKGDQPFQLLDEKKLRAAAAKMGDGVTFVEAKPLTNAAGGEGFTATYAFTDINKLKLDENPGQNIPGAGQAAQLGPKAKVEPVTFQFTKGAPAVLTLKMPQPKNPDLAKQKAQLGAGGDDMAMAMMQQMFKDMKMSLVLEVAGRIVQTNAENRDGSRVTLMEMDFNKVLANPEKLKALTKAQPQTVEETKALVKGMDGIKVETQPEVTIKFQ